MLIRQISDLHNDLERYEFNTTDKDKEVTLVLCGDIDMAHKNKRYGDYLEYVSQLFKYVILVAGNHEYWRCDLTRTHTKIQEQITQRNLTNVFYLNNETVVLDGVAFIGATFWTNIKNPLEELIIHGAMNDYKYIRCGPAIAPWKRPILVSDLTMKHYESRGFIENESIKHSELGHKVVVVTHHAPSRQSIPAKYGNDPCNAAYASELDYWLSDGYIDYWMHGHIHTKCDYVVGNCRVTCNPRGYIQHTNGGLRYNEQTGYADHFYIEIL